MSYHAENGREYVGLRTKFSGDLQVVYDSFSGQRMILNVKNRSTKHTLIDAALRDSIACKNVLAGLMSALHSRAVEVEVEVAK